jgi:chromosome segregation ATPase
VTANGDRRFEKILQGIQYLIRDNELLREDLKEYARRAEEDRKKFWEHMRKVDEDREEFREFLRQAKEDREEFREFARRAEEDRREFREFVRQAEEDRKQAAQDRRTTNELIDGIRRALAVIGKRAGEFIDVQKKQGETLERIEKKLSALGRKNGNGPR